MKQITLVCAAGMSTSLLVKKMRAAAEKYQVEAEIVAVSKDNFAERAAATDALLLGPQIGYMLDDFSTTYAGEFPVAVIDTVNYGTMNGAKVLKQALDMIGK